MVRARKPSLTTSRAIVVALCCKHHCLVVPARPRAISLVSDRRAVDTPKWRTVVTWIAKNVQNVLFSPKRHVCAGRRNSKISLAGELTFCVASSVVSLSNVVATHAESLAIGQGSVRMVKLTASKNVASPRRRVAILANSRAMHPPLARKRSLAHSKSSSRATVSGRRKR